LIAIPKVLSGRLIGNLSKYGTYFPAGGAEREVSRGSFDGGWMLGFISLS
jgi:hypothetical protein